MLKKLLKAAAALLLLLLVSAAGLYLAGARIFLDGGGSPHLRFGDTAAQHAEAVARHRETQRQQTTTVPTTDGASTSSAPVKPADGEDEKPELKPATAIDRPASMYWTDFRGPQRDGTYRQRPIATAWPTDGLKPMWKQPIGGGYASFVIARGRAFTIEQRADQEVVAAYDVVTGRELWTNTWAATFVENMGGDGPRATPTWADGRVYALGGKGELRVLDDETGRVVWRTNILDDAGASNLQWGMSASPLIVDNAVVVLPGGSGGRSIAAYERATGKPLWSVLDDQQSYSSPMLTTIAGVRQIVIFSASRVMGLSPAGGTLLWEYAWKTPYDVNASQPLVIGGNRLFLSTGYSTGAALIELTPAADKLAVREVWRTNRMKNQFTSSVFHDGYIYGLDESILACLDAATGELKWKGGRYGYGQTIMASGHVIVLTESGELALVRATPERHVEVARSPALEGKTWNHPAMSDGVLLVRNANEMAAFDLSRTKSN